MENLYYKCDGFQMRVTKNMLGAVQDYMDEAYIAATNLQAELQKKEKWTGQSELVAEAFLDLLVQYQKDFYGDGNPQELAISAVKELNDNVSDFYDNFPDYNTLKEFTE
ncbi:MAG: hypothetical protein IJJ59_14515 [Pseudobutyrivibrio sp.]|uniref:hypothetical protein n=1 Tax=Pseudobutyrivibrio sp. TaxID=2014367 RepID=UPI0025E84DB6|nr:hypothetical protein [Pseudobutyrivibrio sp.]MBQ6464537.1 hypothetical protein [Pseudobutyrivibrio sp.]